MVLYREIWIWHERRTNFASNSSSYSHVYCTALLAQILSLLLLVSPVCSKHCSLYEPPIPGIVCLHGNKVTTVLSNSSTSWMVEFYSSWCGHCQHFAPTMKEVGEETQSWSRLIKIGVIDCTDGRENQEECNKYGVQGYPTMKVST